MTASILCIVTYDPGKHRADITDLCGETHAVFLVLCVHGQVDLIITLVGYCNEDSVRVLLIEHTTCAAMRGSVNHVSVRGGHIE